MVDEQVKAVRQVLVDKSRLLGALRLRKAVPLVQTELFDKGRLARARPACREERKRSRDFLIIYIFGISF